MSKSSPPAAFFRPAIVMNMFYTGLGIARSLGRAGVRVIGLSAHRRAYGNYTRFAEVRSCPDSRERPELLFEFLLKLGKELGGHGAIFPTRDDDVVFLDRYREQLSEYFRLALPERGGLEGALDKWKTYEWALKANVKTPRSWDIRSMEDLRIAAAEVSFPCVLKPTSAYLWRKTGNWDKVGRRKAVSALQAEELFSAYAGIEQAESRALLQEQVPGGDDCLLIAACYMDRECRLVAGFTAQKLLQIPEGLGTGAIVRSTDQPELLQMAERLLKAMRYNGIAEVEFKRDARSGEYKLIEINARPWDQHRLGYAAGVDLISVAYRDLCGLPMPALRKAEPGWRWIAEDVFSLALLHSVWKRNGNVRRWMRLARGKRIFAVWSLRDPLPWFALALFQIVPELIRSARRLFASMFRPGTAEEGAASTHALAKE